MKRADDGLHYQMVTVVAVFLALGLGMAAGGAILGEEGLIRRYDALITALEADFARVREEGRRQRQRVQSLTGELAAARATSDDLVHWAVNGRLAGQRIAVVVVGEAGLPEDLDSTLRKAGAEVLSVSRIIVPGPAGAVRASPTLSPEPANAAAVAVLALASALVNPEHPAAVARLEGASPLTVDGSFPSPPTAVLLIAGPSAEQAHDPEAVDLALARVLARAGIRVVGAGAGSASAGHIDRYRRAALPSVGELGDPIELVRAVYLLAGLSPLPDGPDPGQIP